MDLDYKQYKSEKLHNRVAYAEFLHFENYHLEKILEEESVKNVQEFINCMYRD